MEQLLLFDYCPKCLKKERLGKRKKNSYYYRWSYWKPESECEGCMINLSIKTLASVRRYRARREYYRKRAKNLSGIKRIRKSLRLRLGKFLKQAINNPTKKHYKGKNKLVGCNNTELKNHLEARFVDGMNWENYGKMWHVDHIKPCSLFDVTKQEDLLAINHYTNLQPLWASDNLKKSDTYVQTKTT